MIKPILIYHFLLSLCFAQSSEYVVQQWKVEDGLPQSTVRCITQTHDGYLWAGTWNGLVRFDGVRMTIFNASNSPELLSSNIMSIFTDRSGQLWIGTEPGGIVRYSNGQFKHFDSTDGCSATRILSINQDHSGRMWFATEIGIYTYDGRSFHHYTEANGLPRTYANQVMPFPDGRMYLGFVNYAAKIHMENDSLVVEESFPVGGYAAAIDSAGTVWYGFPGKGFIQRSNGKEIIEKRSANEKPAETYILHDQEKWLLTSNAINIISRTKNEVLDQVDGISFSDITTIFEDREGNIWMGKEGNGLICLRKKNIRVLSKQSGLQSDLIMCGLEDRSGRLWIGTWDVGLLLRSDPLSKTFNVIRMQQKVMGIFSLTESHTGEILAGVWGSGLFSVRPNGVQRFSKGMFRDDVSIIAVVEDARRHLWIGTAHDGVAEVIGDSITMWNTELGLSSNRINSMICKRNGELWVSVSGAGVNRISNGVVSVYKKGNGLNDNFASPIYEDKDGSIWIGTKRGVTRWKPDLHDRAGGKGTFSYITEQQGLFDDAVAQIIEDDRGYFWFGAIHGIYRVSKQELNDAADGNIPSVRCFTIGKEDGMLNEETGGGNPRCWKTADGKLWFSTSSGVVIIDPRTITSNTAPPNIIIEDVWVENQLRKMSKEIVLQPGETKIELRYTGINFTAPDKMRFKYILEGSDREWSDASTQRIVRYTNLDPGTYTFRVRSVNNVGIWSTDEASLLVNVLPPFYATWWFRSMMILFFLTIGPAVYVFRVKQLMREKEKQVEFSRQLIESQESERKRIATELHDGLGQNLLIIKNKLLVALQTLTKEIPSTTQVEEASDIVTNTIEEVRSISHNLRPHQLDQLGITKTLRSIVRQANGSTPIEFIAEIQDIDGILSSEQEISLFRIVQESFNNIIKHSGATRVRIAVTRNEKIISVTVADNGKGLPIETNNSISPSAGFGISGMKERAKMFGWEFTIESKQGMNITMNIPL